MKHLKQKSVLAAKKIFNLAGLDIQNASKNPEHTFLGLDKLSIKTIIDVGANRGQFAIRTLKIFPQAKIYSFEPIQGPFQKLKELAELEKRIIPSNLALGEEDRIIEMLEHTEHSPSSSFLRTTEICQNIWPCTKEHISVPVKMTTLDAWVESLNSPPEKDILIKIDVQGYEDRVIKGGGQVFNSARACILEVCLDKLYEGQADFKQICDLLYPVGFSYAGNLLQSYGKDGHIIFIDAVFVKK